MRGAAQRSAIICFSSRPRVVSWDMAAQTSMREQASAADLLAKNPAAALAASRVAVAAGDVARLNPPLLAPGLPSRLARPVGAAPVPEKCPETIDELFAMLEVPIACQVCAELQTRCVLVSEREQLYLRYKLYREMCLGIIARSTCGMRSRPSTTTPPCKATQRPGDRGRTSARPLK